MDEELCDRLITEYNKKLYGFALSKTGSIERVEELAARITLEVYTSLLRRENILNANAYIYRVAQNAGPALPTSIRILPTAIMMKSSKPAIYQTTRFGLLYSFASGRICSGKRGELSA